MSRTCCFCAKFASGRVSSNARLWDRALFGSPNFVVMPTVGAFLEGWLLIVPRNHYLCMAALRDDLLSELDELRERVSLALRDCYGPTAAFEHGAARPQHAVGCGVDHAHLHILPTDCNLLAGLHEVFPYRLRWRPAQGIRQARALYTAGLDYLYVQQATGRSYVGTHPSLGSQLFRRVLAAHAGSPCLYDWRAFPQKDKVDSTVRVLDAWISRQRNHNISLRAVKT